MTKNMKNNNLLTRISDLSLKPARNLSAEWINDFEKVSIAQVHAANGIHNISIYSIRSLSAMATG
jgi:hypothetical protein